jgi:hypothetical protein
MYYIKHPYSWTQYINFEVKLNATNGYKKHNTIPPFELQSFIGNATNFRTIQYLQKESCQLMTNLTH